MIATTSGATAGTETQLDSNGVDEGRVGCDGTPEGSDGNLNGS